MNLNQAAQGKPRPQFELFEVKSPKHMDNPTIPWESFQPVLGGASFGLNTFI